MPRKTNITSIVRLTAAVALALGAPGISAQVKPPISLEGQWRLEFRSEPGPADPTAKPTSWLTFNTVVVQVDSGVGGAMQSTGPTGQFACKRRGDDVCAGGRMRLSWDDQEWQVFEFKLTPGDPNRGAGKAEIRFPTGQTDRYTFTMVRN